MSVSYARACVCVPSAVGRGRGTRTVGTSNASHKATADEVRCRGGAREHRQVAKSTAHTES